MVADALVYHPSVAHYLRFAATTVGKDKLLRLLQYFARFYSWYLLRTNGTPAQIAPWDAIKKQFGTVRKVLRFGKNLGYASYLTFDALALPDVLGIRKNPNVKTLTANASRAWAVGIVFSIVAQTYTLYRLRVREAQIDRKDGEGVVESKRIKIERATSQLQLLSDLCDFTNPASALGWANFDDGFVGLAGTTSSLIGIYNQWRKTA
ncbi:hypothetical protein LLEC1_04445 [Akanthomyces lecanii]|uniref:Peroxisomal biogenesis factor 11 n=1 Tax=Cordyceps confragosa TaxID=2714763 RepID=A0A179I3Z8_CORDF|nr:hypothetical protein LLEC1_04445 [Akanthomyces lecanii]